MATERYCDFIDRICHLARIPRSPSMHDSADLEIDDVRFTLIDASTMKEDGVAFFCDFGLPPSGKQRAEVLHRLLELNLVMSGINTPVFTINRQSGHVLMMGRVPLAHITPKDIVSAFSTYAMHAKAWRKTYFLLDGERAASAPVRGSAQQVLKQRGVQAQG